MDDQGAGGSSRRSGTNTGRRPVRESSLPTTLLPHLYHAPRDTSPQRFAPLTVPDWPSQSSRSRSQDYGRSLPSPSHLLRQTEPTFDYDHVISSRSLDASPVNPSPVTNPDLPPPRLILQRPTPVDDPPHPRRDRSMGGYSYPSGTRSMSTSPYESHFRPYSHAPQYGRERMSWTPLPPQPPSRQTVSSPGIQDVFMDDVGVLPQPEVPVRPPRDPYAELRHSPGFAQEQRRGRSEFRITHTSRAQHLQVQVQDHRLARERGHAEGSQREPQRQIEPFPSRSIRGTHPVFPLPPNVTFAGSALAIPPSLYCSRYLLSHSFLYLLSSGEGQLADRLHRVLLIIRPFFYRKTTTRRAPHKPL